ncbi:MRPL25 [Sanghuangporus vaninii]
MSQVAPELIKRFRARELRRLIERGRMPQMDSTGSWRVPAKVMTLHNPFLPRPLFDPSTRKNAETATSKQDSIRDQRDSKQQKSEKTKERKDRKKWAQPHYSLRQQAVLVKLARTSGTLHLLPPGPKLSIEEIEAAKREVELRTQPSVPVTNDHGSVDSVNVPSETKEKSNTSRVEASSTTLAEDPSQQPVQATRAVSIRRSLRHFGYPGVVFNWTGKAPEKPRKRLTIYVGRRRMFKGHKWERHLDKRRARIAVRMRDMRKRIRRFKNHYKRRRPNPLKPAVPRKRETLPF